MKCFILVYNKLSQFWYLSDNLGDIKGIFGAMLGNSSGFLHHFFQMRRFSQHMETIQGQLQLIVEQMPSFVQQQRSAIEVRHQTTNGHTQHMEVSSPLSNDDHSPDTVDDTDDNATENNQESPLGSTRESMETPTLGTPESDGNKLVIMEY